MMNLERTEYALKQYKEFQLEQLKSWNVSSATLKKAIGNLIRNGNLARFHRVFNLDITDYKDFPYFKPLPPSGFVFHTYEKRDFYLCEDNKCEVVYKNELYSLNK